MIRYTVQVIFTKDLRLVYVLVFVASLFYFDLAASISAESLCERSLGLNYFPGNLEFDDRERGLVTRTIPMNPLSLKQGYSKGLFPWIDNGDGTFSWYSPPERGVLFFEDFTPNRTLRKDLRRAREMYRVTFDRDFEAVIRASMASERRGEEGEAQGTWITDAFVDNYISLHKEGVAHSIEVWDKGDNTLVGGLYGVFVNGVFSGESMFNKKNNASKLALSSLIDHLKKKGFQWIDIQEVSAISSRFGGKAIPRGEFFQLQAEAKRESLKF
ncbi:leucyl/phenylalanyl-tRNA--protein transferase [Bdellovibrionales bacterium]|nr:leucyl/phenylalanyl-tRNA--protein transferase [Bdellovibrionales bacterium]